MKIKSPPLIKLKDIIRFVAIPAGRQTLVKLTRLSLLAPLGAIALHAQTVATTEDGEVINVAQGQTINGGAANGVELNNDDSQLNNQGTVITNGPNAVSINADDVSVNNQSGGTISGASRAVDFASGNRSQLTNAAGATIVGSGDQRNGTVYVDSDVPESTINNAGIIDAGANNNGAGFSAETAASGSQIDLNNSGSIIGRGNAGAGAATAGDGIRFERTRVAGALDGSTTGLVTGNLTNSGTISSEGANGTVAGIRVVNGVSYQGTLDNSGTISGVQNGLYFGNPTPAGGADHTGGVVNNSGTISSDSRALNFDGTGLELNNSGVILGTGNQRNGTAYADSTAQDFTLNNLEGGRIDAGEGLEGAGFSAELDEDGNNFTINNEGEILGRGNASAGAATAGDGIRLERTRVDGALEGSTTGLFTGTIDNSGSITSEAANGTAGGVRVVNGVSFQGTLDNSGTISGVQNGLYFGNPTPAGGGDHTGGVVNNSGTISSDSRALNIDGTGLEVNNSGVILGTGNQRNGTAYADSTAQDFTLNNLEGGRIDAGEGLEGAGFSAELDQDGNNFTINNEGEILGRGNASAGAATAGDGIRLERTRVDGALEGSTTGLFTGTIDNSGSITSEAANGTAGGVRVVNGVSFQGTLDNSGTISGVQNGLYFGNPTPAGGGDHTGGVVNNSGTISSDSRALNIDGTGLELNNSGVILGTGNQRNGTAYADSTAQDFTLNNLEGGRIDAGEGLEGAGFSAELDEDGNNFTINNEGEILGRGNASAGAATAGDGIRLERTRVDGALEGSTTGLFTGTIDNSGSITSEAANGTAAGVRIVNGVSFQGTLDNSGTISGVQNGLYFGNPTPAGGADHTGGVVNNSGTISSDSRALNIDGIGLEVNNSGTIIGTGDQRNGTVYYDGTANNTTFDNTESGVIDAGEGNSGSGISIESEPGEIFHDISNSGLVQGRSDGAQGGPDAGFRIFGADSSTNSTRLVNTESGRILSDASAGILLQDINFTGSIENRGTISGETAAIDTRTALGNITVNQLSGSLLGGVLLGEGDDVLNLGGDSLVTGDINLGAGNNTVSVLADSAVRLQSSELVGDLSVAGGLGLQVSNTLAIDGDALFGPGSQLNLDAQGAPLQLDSPVTVLTTTGTVTTNGPLAVSDNSILTDFAVTSTANSIQSQASLSDLDNVLQDQNVISFGNALQGDLADGGFDANVGAAVSTLDSITDADAFEAAAAEVLPDLNIGLTRELYESQSNIFNSLSRRLAGPQTGAWVEAFGRSANRDGGSAATDTGYDASGFGFILGYDSQVSSALTVGAAFAYLDTDLDTDLSSGDLESYSFNLYANYQVDDAFIRGALAYSFGELDSTRNSALGSIDSDTDANQFSALIAAGVTKTVGSWTISPLLSLEYGNTSLDDFSEQGGLNLSVDADAVNVLEIGAGVEVGTTFAFDGKAAFLRGHAGYTYDILNEERELSAQFAGGNRFDLEGESAAAGSFELGLEVGFEIVTGQQLSFGYEGEFSSDFDSHTGFVRYGFQF